MGIQIRDDLSKMLPFLSVGVTLPKLSEGHQSNCRPTAQLKTQVTTFLPNARYKISCGNMWSFTIFKSLTLLKSSSV